MKLIELNKHDVFKIVDFGEVCNNMKERLSSMGVTKNSMGQILHKGFFGPIEVEFNNSKIAIGRKMAKKIEVKKYECPIFQNENIN
jgi:Fe2+ transport system protein FeoA